MNGKIFAIRLNPLETPDKILQFRAISSNAQIRLWLITEAVNPHRNRNVSETPGVNSNGSPSTPC
jgi:hypothetical protein